MLAAVAVGTGGMVAGAASGGAAPTGTGGVVTAPASGGAAPAGTTVERLAVSAAASTLQVDWRGNGHGHGMSQYGALGAANDGLRARKILAFYYPGTSLTTDRGRRVRVRISHAAPWTTVFAGRSGLRVLGRRTPLPAGYGQFRFAPDGNGLLVAGRKRLSNGHLGRWVHVLRRLPASAAFYSTARSVRLVLSNGSSTVYRGRIVAERRGAGEITVNNVRLDGYVRGVVSREMSPSWPKASLAAQAIAARSYVLASKAAAGHGAAYDICDDTNCQVYGGMAHYGPGGRRLWRCDDSVVDGNQNQVLTYNGSAVFAQYAASNGGASVDGGQPYLVGRTDPYDTWRLSHDPYLNQSRSISATRFAAAFGLQRVSSITVSRRDGNGPWGGRVLRATVTGTTSGGSSKSVTTDGFGLGDAAQVWTDYVRFGS